MKKEEGTGGLSPRPVEEESVFQRLAKALRRAYQFWIARMAQRFSPIAWVAFALAITATVTLHSVTAKSAPTGARPKVILISLDGATASVTEQFFKDGTLRPNRGLGLLKSRGVFAQQNVTVTPSLTAPSHIAIGTGSTAARNDISANSFHLVASPFTQNVSGFAAPIGGYALTGSGPADTASPTAESLWIALRKNGKKVVAATFPGADGIDVRVPGLASSPIIQPASERTVDYTVPFGAFGGVGAQGFGLTKADFSPAPPTTVNQLLAAGKTFYGTVLQKVTSLETFSVGGVTYNIQVAAFDSSNDGKTNYDTLVFFDLAQGIQPGPFKRPATGPAYVRAADKKSSLFYLEGSPNKVGASYYVSALAPDLASVRIARYSANFIPRNAAVLANVDDINNNVGFWAPQPDFRIPERLSPGFTNFPDSELEAIYEDQVRSFVDYQTRVVLRAIAQTPGADLVLTYIEQPDGSGHQFTLTDRRQATDFKNPNSIGSGQDAAKVNRYKRYVRRAYQIANQSVQRIIDAVGVDSSGRPRSNIIVVSDHGMAPFHTAVSLTNFLTSQGFDPSKVRAVTSGAAANLYINLQGREAGGTVSAAEYTTLKQQLVQALRRLADPNRTYTQGGKKPIFELVEARPASPNKPLGLGTSALIGQDSGDVLAILAPGYNFDGTQNPVVQRAGDAPSSAPVLSVPNFYGAHGYNAQLPLMSAIFYAAGPDIGRGSLGTVRNIDVAPTILKLLGVRPSPRVQGTPLDLSP